MTQVKINGVLYDAEVNGRLKDPTANGRNTKSITMTTTTAELMALLPDNTPWSIVFTPDVDGAETQEYDNSEYSMAGDVTDHRDGTATIKMMEPSDSDLLRALIGDVEGVTV